MRVGLWGIAFSIPRVTCGCAWRTDNPRVSSYRVTPAAVLSATSPLHGIPASVTELHGRVGSHRSAGERTPADGAVQGLMGQWAQVLPLYALSAERLTAAVAAAAVEYQRTDESVAEAADPRGEPRGG
jgi:hypothetical protein